MASVPVLVLSSLPSTEKERVKITKSIEKMKSSLAGGSSVGQEQRVLVLVLDSTGCGSKGAQTDTETEAQIGHRFDLLYPHYCIGSCQSSSSRIETEFCTRLLQTGDQSFGQLSISTILDGNYRINVAFYDVVGADYVDNGASAAAIVTANNVDILLSSGWPLGVEKKSQLAATKDISSTADTAVDTATAIVGSASSSMVEHVLACKPRYHFASGGCFFEREPYRNPTPDFDGSFPITRFIGLANLDATTRDKKEKSMYAFYLKPKKQESSLPTGTTITSCPFTDSLKRRADDQDISAPSYFFQTGLDTTQPSKRAKGPPPETYTCKICNVKGHWIQECPERDDIKPNDAKEGKERSEVPPDTYTCKICGVKGHWIQSCPSKPEIESKPIHASLLTRDTAQCWFCLSNPAIETHLILGILESSYIALAKGGIDRSHLLVVPIVHYASSVDMRIKESGGGLGDVVERMAGCCGTDKVVVAWEGFGGGSGGAGVNERLHHYHMNVVVVSRAIGEKVLERVRSEAAGAGLCRRDAEIGEGFLRVGVYDAQKVQSGGSVVVTEALLCVDQESGVKTRIPLNLVRRVLVQELGLPIYTTDWKKCVLEREEEEEATKEGRDKYAVLLEEE